MKKLLLFLLLFSISLISVNANPYDIYHKEKLINGQVLTWDIFVTDDGVIYEEYGDGTREIRYQPLWMQIQALFQPFAMLNQGEYCLEEDFRTKLWNCKTGNLYCQAGDKVFKDPGGYGKCTSSCIAEHPKNCRHQKTITPTPNPLEDKADKARKCREKEDRCKGSENKRYYDSYYNEGEDTCYWKVQICPETCQDAKCVERPTGLPKKSCGDFGGYRTSKRCNINEEEIKELEVNGQICCKPPTKSDAQCRAENPDKCFDSETILRNSQWYQDTGECTYWKETCDDKSMKKMSREHAELCEVCKTGEGKDFCIDYAGGEIGKIKGELGQFMCKYGEVSECVLNQKEARWETIANCEGKQICNYGDGVVKDYPSAHLGFGWEEDISNDLCTVSEYQCSDKEFGHAGKDGQFICLTQRVYRCWEGQWIYHSGCDNGDVCKTDLDYENLGVTDDFASQCLEKDECKTDNDCGRDLRCKDNRCVEAPPLPKHCEKQGDVCKLRDDNWGDDCWATGRCDSIISTECITGYCKDQPDRNTCETPVCCKNWRGTPVSSTTHLCKEKNRLELSECKDFDMEYYNSVTNKYEEGLTQEKLDEASKHCEDEITEDEITHEDVIKITVEKEKFKYMVDDELFDSVCTHSEQCGAASPDEEDVTQYIFQEWKSMGGNKPREFGCVTLGQLMEEGHLQNEQSDEFLDAGNTMFVSATASVVGCSWAVTKGYFLDKTQWTARLIKGKGRPVATAVYTVGLSIPKYVSCIGVGTAAAAGLAATVYTPNDEMREGFENKNKWQIGLCAYTQDIEEDDDLDLYSINPCSWGAWIGSEFGGEEYGCYIGWIMVVMLFMMFMRMMGGGGGKR